MDDGTWLDSHIHFWDPARLHYPWLAAEPDLLRPFGPADVDAPEVGAFVVVQADCLPAESAAEVDWLSDLAEAGAPIRGIVAHVPLELGHRCEPELSDRVSNPLVVGIRRLIQDEEPGFALAPDFVAGVRMLSAYELAMDVCVRRTQLVELEQLVARCPDVTFILDHMGKPRVDPRERAEWAADLLRLARHPNVRCKLSGLGSETDDDHRTAAVMVPFLHTALDAFGPERCMFGSDWPVAAMTLTYVAWMDVVRSAIADLTEPEREHVRHGCASRTYGRGMLRDVQVPAAEEQGDSGAY